MDQTPDHSVKKLLYFDYFASTPMLDEVARFMSTRLQQPETHANPSAQYAWGAMARARLDQARTDLATSVDLPSSGTVVITSSATESIHLALLGALEAYPRHQHQLLTWAMEHPATLGALYRARSVYHAKTHILVPEDASIDLELLEETLKNNPIFLISLSWVQHELGYIHDWAAVCALARRYGALFHLDASQAIGKCLPHWPIIPDYITLPSHKCFGPKGVAALYIREGIRVAPLLRGGAQQYNYRSGTEPVLLAETLAFTYQLIQKRLPEWQAYCRSLAEAWQDMAQECRIEEHADPQKARVTQTAFVRIPAHYDHLWRSVIMCSQGSACAQRKGNFSETLTLMNIPQDTIAQSYRISWSHMTDVESYEILLKHLRRAYEAL